MHALRVIGPGALIAVLATLLAATPASADEGGFSTTNLQLLQGWSFHDNLLGYDTPSGSMTTITLNHFSTWAYGDNFAFVDFYRGNFTDGSKAKLYAEWHPRLFLDQVFGLKPGGFARHWGIAAEVNQAQGFYAYLAGAGMDLAIPGFAVAGVNLYYRYDNFNYHTWQLSPFWTIPFSIGPLQLVFTGFLDLFQDRDGKLDLMTQPELLLDVLALFGGRRDRLYLGVEWYLHSYQDFVDDQNKVVSAPQAMLQWTVY